MQRNRFLEGLAGPVLLGLDDGTEYRGFSDHPEDMDELDIILDVFDDAGLMSQKEAESKRNTEWTILQGEALAEHIKGLR
jgi:hypothetical protein